MSALSPLPCLSSPTTFYRWRRKTTTGSGQSTRRPPQLNPVSPQPQPQQQPPPQRPPQPYLVSEREDKTPPSLSFPPSSTPTVLKLRANGDGKEWRRGKTRKYRLGGRGFAGSILPSRSWWVWQKDTIHSKPYAVSHPTSINAPVHPPIAVSNKQKKLLPHHNALNAKCKRTDVLPCALNARQIPNLWQTGLTGRGGGGRRGQMWHCSFSRVLNHDFILPCQLNQIVFFCTLTKF